jgi:hypothetical protein
MKEVHVLSAPSCASPLGHHPTVHPMLVTIARQGYTRAPERLQKSNRSCTMTKRSMLFTQDIPNG